MADLPRVKVYEDGRVTVMAVYDPITLDQLLAVTRHRVLANMLFGKVGDRPWRLVTGYRGRDELDERLTDAEVSGWRDAAVVPVTGVRDRLVLALCEDHGHAKREAKRECRTCQRRADVALSVLGISAAAWAERQTTTEQV